MSTVLQLKRPLVILDLETTGVNVGSDRIVEMAMVKLHPSGERKTWSFRVNPTIPIPAESTAVHGISDDDVRNEPTFAAMAQEILAFLGGSDLAGYNSNKFDIPLLIEEFTRVSVHFDINSRKLIDVQNIFHKMEQRTLVAAYKFYCEKDLTAAHSAAADAEATLDVLLAQVERYDALRNDVDFLSEFSSVQRNVDLAGRIIRNEKGEEVFNFGKHKGKRVTEVFRTDTSYYDWMMKGDFPTNTKNVITQIRLKDFNKA
jgi:DNA polymerase-3 subunit epsilon